MQYVMFVCNHNCRTDFWKVPPEPPHFSMISKILGNDIGSSSPLLLGTDHGFVIIPFLEHLCTYHFTTSCCNRVDDQRGFCCWRQILCIQCRQKVSLDVCWNYTSNSPKASSLRKTEYLCKKVGYEISEVCLCRKPTLIAYRLWTDSVGNKWIMQEVRFIIPRKRQTCQTSANRL